MLAVLHIPTGHYVYREEPEFTTGMGLKNAVVLGLGTPDELVEVQITEREWEEDQERQRQEAPPTIQDQIDALDARIKALENGLG